MFVSFVRFRPGVAALCHGLRAGLLAILFAAGAQASIQLNALPAGTASVAFEGNASYSRPFNNFSHSGLPSTIVTKSFRPGMSGIVFDNVTFASSDLDFLNAAGIGNGFRWSERIFNNTGSAWATYTITLSETQGQFITGVSFGGGSFVTINNGGPILAGGPNAIRSDDLAGKLDSLGTVTTSAGNKVLTFAFNTPLQSGSFVDLYAPIGLLPNPGTALGSFQLAQAFGPVVPEAASIATWGLLALTAGSGLWIRRRAGKS